MRKQVGVCDRQDAKVKHLYSPVSLQTLYSRIPPYKIGNCHLSPINKTGCPSYGLKSRLAGGGYVSIVVGEATGVGVRGKERLICTSRSPNRRTAERNPIR